MTDDRNVTTWLRGASKVQDENEANADDYSYLLYCRSRLENALRDAEEPPPTELAEAVRRADDLFRELTEEDSDQLLGSYVNLSRVEGWWYRRIPRKGPIRRQLDGVPQPERPPQ